MAVQDPQSLFVLELSRLHCTEQAGDRLMQQFSNEIQNPQLKNLITDHIKDTAQQLRNLEQCAQVLGQQISPVACPIADGFMQDRQDLMKQQPTIDVIQLADIGAVEKWEHTEIGAYQVLVDMARAMNQPQCVSLLEQNLRDEQAMANRVQQLGSQVIQQMVQRQARAA